jgi:16S rRNA processing protein RimM
MSKRQNNDRLLHIATLGRTVGLGGDMKLHLYTDFPEQFVPGETFYTKERTPLLFESINLDRELVKLEGIDTPEAAKRYTNTMVYTTYGRTREVCKLEPGQYFWFDIVGAAVTENGLTLGKVLEIERIGAVDYLQIKTDDAFVKQGLPKQFLVPYQPPFIEQVDTDAGTIALQGALDILEAS